MSNKISKDSSYFIYDFYAIFEFGTMEQECLRKKSQGFEIDISSSNRSIMLGLAPKAGALKNKEADLGKPK